MKKREEREEREERDNRVERIEFYSENFLIKGVLHLPGTKAPPLVVGSHGLEGSKESAKQKKLSTLLIRKNIAFFRFDHRGCGESQGDFVKETSLEKRTRDYINAVLHILSLGKTGRNLMLFGSSMGGATCINAWEELQEMDISLCGAVLCSAPVKSRTIENIPMDANGDRPALPLNFFEQNLLFNLEKKAEKMSHLMIFHGDADEVVPVSNAHDIFKSAGNPKKMIIQKNGDHRMTSKKDQMEFDSESIAWFMRCLEQRDQVLP